MWICDAPSSTARRASAAYSSGVYGMAGHWSRLAIAPLMEQLMITGSLKVLMPLRSSVASCSLLVARGRERATPTPRVVASFEDLLAYRRPFPSR